PSGDHATIRATTAERHAERLRFHGDDVGLPWRLPNAKGNSLGDRNNQQRAVLVSDFGDAVDVFESAKEVRRLDKDAGGLGRDRLLKFFEVDAATIGKSHCGERHSLVRG